MQGDPKNDYMGPILLLVWNQNFEPDPTSHFTYTLSESEMAHRAAKNCNGNASKFGNGGDIETRWQKWKAQSINQNSKMAEETTNQRGSSKASQSINQKVLCSDTSNRCVAFWISYQYQYQYCGYHSNQWSAIQ